MKKLIGVTGILRKRLNTCQILRMAQTLFVPKSKNKAFFSDFLKIEDGTDGMSRSIGK